MSLSKRKRIRKITEEDESDEEVDKEEAIEDVEEVVDEVVDDFIYEDKDMAEVENMLCDYDNEGMPKSSAGIGTLQLPPGFQLARRKRFKNAYVSPSISSNELFAKKTLGLNLLGKRNYERRLMDKFVAASNEFTSIASSSKKSSPEFESVDGIMKEWMIKKMPRVFLESHLTMVADFLKEAYRSYVRQLKDASKMDSASRVTSFWNKIDLISENVMYAFHYAFLKGLDLKITLNDWSHSLNTLAAEKNTLIDYQLLYKQCLMATPPDFDESSNWGLKPLRHTFIPPYFKNWDGQAAAPKLFEQTRSTELIKLTITTKQKWTVKDVTELEKTIRSVVIEEKLVKARQVLDTMTKAFQTLNSDKRDEDILDEVNNGTEDKAVRFRNGRPGSSNRKKGTKISSGIKLKSCLPEFEGVPLPEEFTLLQVKSWYAKTTKEIQKLKYKDIFENGNVTADNIDWNAVSTKIMTEKKKLRLPEDCKLCFIHGADPTRNNNRRWSKQDKEVFATLKNDPRVEWEELGKRFEPDRPEFQVFYKWRKTLNPPKKMEWSPEKDHNLAEALEIYNANWNKVAAEIEDGSCTKKQVQERFKKSKNPILRFGKFTRVEDCLMLLTIEKLKGHFNREKHFGILTAYLPWRYESAWRDRAENLFAEYIIPWTLEEDKKLMHLAKSMKRDWSKIAKQFNSFKTRKGCLTRYKILEKRLKDFPSLEEYHHSYAMIRYNVREYRHLRDIADLLQSMLDGKVYEFEGFPRDRPPTESELQDYILSFDHKIVASAVQNIEKYIEKRDEFWKEWRQKSGLVNGEKRKTHDRRTFHPENTQSIASALHIREVGLLPRTLLKFELSERENEIYKFYAQFCSTKPLKKDKPRPYIPMARELVKLPDVKRIVLRADMQMEISDTELAVLTRKRPQARKKTPKSKAASNKTKTLKKSMVKNPKTKTPKKTPVKKSTVKTPKKTPVKKPKTKTPKVADELVQLPGASGVNLDEVLVDDMEMEISQATTGTAAASNKTKTLKKTPVKKSTVKTVKKKPVKKSTVKTPKKTPVKKSTVKTPKKTAVKKSAVKTPRKTPVKKLKTKTPKMVDKLVQLQDASGIVILDDVLLNDMEMEISQATTGTAAASNKTKTLKKTPVKKSTVKTAKKKPVKKPKTKTPKVAADELVQLPGASGVILDDVLLDDMEMEISQATTGTAAASNKTKTLKKTPVKKSTVKTSKKTPVKKSSVKTSKKAPVKKSKVKTPKIKIKAPPKTKEPVKEDVDGKAVKKRTAITRRPLDLPRPPALKKIKIEQ